MPSTVKVRIKSARNLPVMDNNHHPSTTTAANKAISNLRNIPGSISMGAALSSHSQPSTDAYVVVTLGGHVNLTDQEEESSKQKRYTQKTKVCKRTLNPVWDEGAKRKNVLLSSFGVVGCAFEFSFVFGSIDYVFCFGFGFGFWLISKIELDFSRIPL